MLILCKFGNPKTLPLIQNRDNGRQAVNAVKMKKYDLILMDCMMPELNGIEASEKIRTEIPPHHQPNAIIGNDRTSR